MRPIRERPHRLPAAVYVGQRAVAFTACVCTHVHLFVDAETVGVMDGLLREAAEHYHCAIVIYLFMPDHLHTVLMSIDDGDPLSAMKRFKQRSSYWLAHHRPGVHWQKDFYDRIVRTEREFRNHIRYILNNPVRAGLVDDFRIYPFKGSTVFEIENWEVS